MKKLFYLFFLVVSTASQVQAQDQIKWVLKGFYAQETAIPVYRNCVNRFTSTFQKVKTRGNKHTEKTIEINDVKYEAENGTIIQINAQEFSIVPNQGTITRIFAKSGGKIIAQAEFKVIFVPSPLIFLSDSPTGKPINLKNPISVSEKLFVIAEADQNFKKIIPKEADYQVKNVEVNLFRGGRAITQQIFWSSELDMSKFQVKEGDGIQLTIRSAFRKTSTGESELAPITTPYIGFFVLN